MDNNRRFLGLTVASAAAALFVAATPALAADSTMAQVKCYGVNACKGQGQCKTAMNSCKGHNSCKGQGFVMMDEKACIEHWSKK
jgi:hypothetical protein